MSNEFRTCGLKHVGKVYFQNDGSRVEVIEGGYSSGQVRIRITNEHNEFVFHREIQHHRLKTGSVKDPHTPRVSGVGYIGVGHTTSLPEGGYSKCYREWSGMLYRVTKIEGASVCPDWHNYQNFVKWYTTNNIEGCKLFHDKRISAVYGPESCSYHVDAMGYILNRRRQYLVRTPEGKPMTIINMKEFCKEHGLEYGCMLNVQSGKSKQHVGWTKR